MKRKYHRRMTAKKRSTLHSITAHTYDGVAVRTPERTYHFPRPYSASKPTFLGAARMVAAVEGCLPSEVSVARVESAVVEQS
jgi:hypothetical protein